MSYDIRHDGIVERINGRHVRVRIVQSSACGSCKIAGHCHAAESNEKLIDVVANGKDFSVGQQVVVSTSGTVVRQALLLGFGIPLAVLVGVLLVMLFMGYGDDVAGMAAVGSLLPYYVLLWLLRHRVARQVSFSIEA